ncbi:S9 family peptidase [Parenemella sanctibonifatiensis]|uniref:S9 family peptidase n=1 Tax=Parenemella sanctibonifatiensis TaxID=2016505 RepID=UPI0015C63632|nr:prolyl oligopeptidase family serine peptidase [Parenemella sanctibonifatiensis]
MTLPVDLMTQLLSLENWLGFDIDDDGRVLAGCDAPGSTQLFELAGDAVPRQLTDLPTRCSGRYVPGRRMILVSHDDGGNERSQISTLDPDDPQLRLEPLVHDPAYQHVIHDVTATELVYSTNRRNGVDMDLVVRNLDDGSERVVYDRGGYAVGAAVSNDRETIAFTRLTAKPISTAIDLVRGGEVSTLTDPDAHAKHSLVGFTPDDSALLLASNHDRDMTAIVSYDLNSGEPTTLVADDDHELDAALSKDGSTLLVRTMINGSEVLSLHEPDGQLRATVDLPVGIVVAPVWATDGSAVLVTHTGPTTPTAIFRIDARTGRTDRVTGTEVPAGLRDHLVDCHVDRVPASDGEEIPVFVYPGRTDHPQSVAALRGASVIHIHGGPESMSSRRFQSVIQALAIYGLTVVVPNVRGSAGYGKRWVSLDDVEKRLDSVGDLAALHAWLPSQGLDASRSALWGASYGGYMVLAGVSMQPELWAAGVDIVGMSSLVTFLENTAPYRRQAREREYGSLEHDRAMLEAASPITYLDQIRAPLMIIHGANDPRVPLSEAEQIAAALDSKGIPHQLKVYADEGHGLAKRANRMDAYPAAYRFLKEQLAKG